MPSKSEKQRRLFSLALSVKRGEASKSDVSADVRNLVDRMSEKELEKFAKKEDDDLSIKEQIKRQVLNKLYDVEK